jgi:hypothetical protein
VGRRQGRNNICSAGLKKISIKAWRREGVREMENKTTQRDMVVKVRVKGLKKLKKVCKKMKKANLLAGKLASFKTLLDFKV